MSGAWPADPAAIEEAGRFLNRLNGRIVVACHNDVDGLSSAVIVLRALAGLGNTVAEPLPARRGEHVHQDAMRDRILALEPAALIITDMGSRPGVVIEGLPTLIIDHHEASGGTPPGAIVVNGYDREPVATSSVLAFVVCGGASKAEGSAWLAALGAIADLGTAAPFAALLGIDARGAAWSRAVSLLNAARRAPEDDALTALRVLRRAASVQDVVSGSLPGVERLQEYKRVVQAEVARCSRAAPLILGDAALIRLSSAAQVHPIVATRWSNRLSPAVVIAANEGFIPGRVNFAVRSAGVEDLLVWLRRLPFKPSQDAEYANGHPRATGGSLSSDDFARFVAVLGARARTMSRPSRAKPA